MLQRSAIAAVLVYGAVTHAHATSNFESIVPQIIEEVAAILLLVGLWTPAAGTIVAVRELLIVFLGSGDRSMPLLLAALGATLAMIGPGAWSIDARLFGRRRIRRLR
jgi:uncharacterized membrane protein YphA (DoxX/SURF4 family)